VQLGAQLGAHGTRFAAEWRARCGRRTYGRIVAVARRQPGVSGMARLARARHLLMRPLAPHQPQRDRALSCLGVSLLRIPAVCLQSSGRGETYRSRRPRTP
jgi:hypothetical protein